MRRHLLALILLLPALAWAASPNNREFHWKGRVAPEKTVTIKALNGSIQVNGTDGDEVEVNASKSGPHADQMEVKVIPSDDGLLICETYNYDGDSSDTCGGGSHSGHSHSRGQMPQVNYEVRIPRNLRLSASSVNGSVSAEHLGRQADVSSVNGAVSVSTTAWAKASSVNGSVTCEFGKADWEHLKLSSVNGSIHVTLPADANTDVRFRSVNGELNSDFPLTVQGRMGRHSMEGRIGSGGRDLELSTVNGSVELQKSTM